MDTLDSTILIPDGFKFKFLGDPCSNDIIHQAKIHCLTTNIFFSDDSGKHWLFDFKINEFWFSTRSISNDLRDFIVEVYNPTLRLNEEIEKRKELILKFKGVLNV